MTSKSRLVAAVIAAGVVVPSVVFGAAAPGPKAKIFARYDTNKNNIIDGAEVAAVRAAFKADRKGEFARYDTNTDGKLDDAEIAEIKPPGQGGKKGGKNDGKKKSGSTQK